MLNVGIHNDVVVEKTEKNDRGTLEITVKKLTEVNPMELLNGSGTGTSFDQQDQKFPIWAPKIEGKTPGVPDTGDNILKKIAEVKDPLTLILMQYMPSTSIKWDMFKGMDGLTPTNLKEKVVNQAVTDKIYGNIADQFIAMMKPHVGVAGKRMRMIFPRQSVAKHFPTLRKKFLDSQPFIEPMTAVPSKLAFSKYEIANKLNDPTPAGGASTVSAGDATAAKNLFAK